MVPKERRKMSGPALSGMIRNCRRRLAVPTLDKTSGEPEQPGRQLPTTELIGLQKAFGRWQACRLGLCRRSGNARLEVSDAERTHILSTARPVIAICR